MSKDKPKQLTCYAIDACTQDQVIDIFEESFGYLSFVEKFVQRIKAVPIDYNTDALASSTKPLIVLDIDNTILFVRFFSDEICVNDEITYYHNGIDETSGIVVAVWYRLKLQLSDDDLIDEYGTDMIEYDHCHTNTTRLKKKKNFAYPYKISETNAIIDSRSTLIKELTVIGCEIEYNLPGFDEHFHKFISFEDDSIEIENFLPALKRKGYKDAAFVYDGFIVRIRPGLEDFLDQLDQHWDIVFFTAANRNVYDGLMQQLHAHLCLNMGKEEETEEPLWEHIFFRDDCTYDFDERGKIYHHKDLTKYNKDLSKVVIVDNSSLSYKSLEPNAILITDFFGKDIVDNELDIVLELTDQIIDIEEEHDGDIFVDYRYILTSIVTDIAGFDAYNDLGGYDRRHPNDILLSTQRFLNDLKESLMQRGKLPTTLKFGEAKPVTDSDEEMAKTLDDDVEALEKDSSQSLESSITQEIKEEEGSVCATPKGSYEAKEDTEMKEEEAHNKNKPLRHSYSISINVADMPHFSSTLTDNKGKKSPLEVIMQGDEDLDDDDLDSDSNDNDGIGSRMELDEDDDEETEVELEEEEVEDSDGSDWDDIDGEEEEKKIEAPPPMRSQAQNQSESGDLPQVIRAQTVPQKEEQLLAPPLHATGPQFNRRFSSMKPRPKHEKIASGMSSVFLKRSVYELTTRRASLTKSSFDYHHEKPIIGSTLGVGSLKDKFERKITHQSRRVRSDSLRGADAKEELEKRRQSQIAAQNSKDDAQTFELCIGAPTENEYNTQYYKTDKPKPKKLIKRIDNPWIAKFKREGVKQPQLARVMRKENKKAPRRLIVQTQEENSIATVQKRQLPPAPIKKRKLPPVPPKDSKFESKNTAKYNSSTSTLYGIAKQYTVSEKKQETSTIALSFNMDGMSMSFSYSPPLANKKKNADAAIAPLESNNGNMSDEDRESEHEQGAVDQWD